MTIVNLELRRKVRVEHLLIEAQVLARQRGADDVADLVRAACVLLQPPDEPGNVVALRRPRAA